jgi:phosphinothricin acetyltransferase
MFHGFFDMDTEILVRDACEQDLPAIVEITNQAIRETTAVWSYTPATIDSRRQWWQDRQQRNYPVLVAEVDNRVVGFASFGDFRPWEGYRYTVEHSVYVTPDRQRQGIGRLLLANLIDRARVTGKHSMIAGIDAANSASLQLHRQFGFVEVGRLPEVGWKFERWLNLVLLQLVLN